MEGCWPRRRFRGIFLKSATTLRPERGSRQPWVQGTRSPGRSTSTAWKASCDSRPGTRTRRAPLSTPSPTRSISTLRHTTPMPWAPCSAHGRAKDLLPSGIRAMEWATRCFQENRTGGHRVFFITPLVESLDLYAPHVPPGTLATWRGRLKAAVATKEAYDGNWTTYLMKGEWLRAKAGLIGREAAIQRHRRPLAGWTEGADQRHALEPVPRSEQRARHAGRGGRGAGQSPRLGRGGLRWPFGRGNRPRRRGRHAGLAPPAGPVRTNALQRADR